LKALHLSFRLTTDPQILHIRTAHEKKNLRCEYTPIYTWEYCAAFFGNDPLPLLCIHAFLAKTSVGKQKLGKQVLVKKEEIQGT